MLEFSSLGGFIQMRPHAEGGILKELGLLYSLETTTNVYVDAGYILKEMFPSEPDMEELYPLLVEFVMRYKYPKMVKRADIEKKLTDLGMTSAGLEKLNLMLRNYYRIWESDF